MISVGSREGFSRRDILMDDNDAELEEGEACSYHDDDNDDDDPTIDPDVALSYIVRYPFSVSVSVLDDDSC